MKHRAALRLDNAYLKRKLELILSGKVIFTELKDADIVFTDGNIPKGSARTVTVGRGSDFTLRVPFSDEVALSLLPREITPTIGITVVGERIFIGEREIKLTELEEALFMKLYSARGEFVCRAELFSVFAEGSSESMLNVYIHYLREKLESDGSRVIISSRKHGYKIDEKYFEGGVADA
ncbi:MAG: helix-turn-helix domain-containing protein [Clostridia bacterium]|nr:helix-turn-helix domain-containing protein [Clostridia bacterium]